MGQRTVIAHINTERGWRGGEQQLAYLLEESKDKNIKVRVICRKNSAIETFCAQQGIFAVGLSFNLINLIQDLRKFRKVCRTAQIVHAHTSQAHTWALMALPRDSQLCLIVSRRVDFPLKSNLLSQWKYNHRSVRRIICVSKRIEREVCRRVNDREKVVTIYSGVDTTLVTNTQLRNLLKLPPNKKLIGTIAALADHKDLFTFLDVAVLFASEYEKVHFVIIGEGPLRRQLGNYIRKLGVESIVTLAGFLPNAGELISGLDVFLFTSKMEGLGSSILDAFAGGVPVVATRAGGIPEIVQHECNGLLSQVGDAKDLAWQVSKVLENETLRHHLTTNAKITLSSFSKEEMADKTFTLYREVSEE